MVRRRCHHARGSRPISQAVPRTVTPSSVTRRANSLPCRVTRICSSPVTRLSSRLSNQALSPVAQTKWLMDSPFQRLAASPRDHALMPPPLERCLHEMKNVRLVIYDETPQPSRPFSRPHRPPPFHPRLGSRRA